MTRTDPAAAALAALDDGREDLAGLLAELIAIPSVGGSDAESQIQAHLADRLHDDGLEVDHWRIDVDAASAVPGFPGMEVERREAWGLVGRLPGTSAGARDDAAGALPALMIDAHVDVVPVGEPGTWSRGPWSGEVSGGVLYGRGACDMKGGLVSALAAVRALRRSGVRLDRDLLLACVPGEEDGGLGTWATLRRGHRAAACVIPEPTGLDVVPANAGALTFRLLVPGLATHAASRRSGVSAVEKFVPVLAALAELEAVRNADVDPLLRRWDLAYPLSIGTVRAGSWASSVPDLLVAEGRLGVALEESAQDARDALEAAVAQVCAGDPWLRDHPVSVQWWGGVFEPGRLAAGSDLDRRVAAAHAAVTGGARPDVWAGPYGSDLRLMAGAGVPTVQYGPGDVRHAHGPDERVVLDDVLTCARTLVLLALDLCGT